MAVRTRTFPSGDCAFIASTAYGRPQAKNQTIFLPGKVALILLVGDIPKPLSLAPNRSALDGAGNGKEFIDDRSIAAFTKGDIYHGG